MLVAPPVALRLAWLPGTHGHPPAPTSPPRTQEHPLRAERPILPRPDVAVLSARRGLTAEFGMGSGDPPLCGSARTGCSRARLQVVNQCAVAPAPWRLHARGPPHVRQLVSKPLPRNQEASCGTYPSLESRFLLDRADPWVHVPRLPRGCQMRLARLMSERSVASSHVGEVLG